MTLIAELTLQTDLPLFETTFEAAPSAAFRIEDVHYVSDEDERTHYVFFVWLTSGDRAAFTAALDDDDTVRAFRHLASPDGRDLYRLTTSAFGPEQSLVFPTAREHDIAVVDTRRDATGLHLRFHVPSREALQSFVDDAREIAETVEVTRISVQEPDDTAHEALTERQQEALALAYDHGYFETPSEVTLDRLAEELDISSQTLSRHIRVGVRKLVAQTVDSVPDSSADA